VSHWNYRLVVTAEDKDDRDIVVCEVYYDDDGTPNGYVDTAPPAGSNVSEALRAYELLRNAFNTRCCAPTPTASSSRSTRRPN
jgi:hypothetical protein